MEQRNLLKELILKSIRRGGLPDLPQLTSAIPAKRIRPIIRSAPRIPAVDGQCLQPKLSKKFPADFFSAEGDLLKSEQKKSQRRLSKRSIHMLKRTNEGSTLQQLLGAQLPRADAILPEQLAEPSMYNTPTFHVKQEAQAQIFAGPVPAFKENVERGHRPVRSQSQRPFAKQKEYTVQQDSNSGYQQTFRIRRVL